MITNADYATILRNVDSTMKPESSARCSAAKSRENVTTAISTRSRARYRKELSELKNALTILSQRCSHLSAGGSRMIISVTTYDGQTTVEVRHNDRYAITAGQCLSGLPVTLILKAIYQVFFKNRKPSDHGFQIHNKQTERF